MSLTLASHTHDGKGPFYHFPIFLIVFDHANACTSMHSLVKIHNNWFSKERWKCHIELLCINDKNKEKGHLRLAATLLLKGPVAFSNKIPNLKI